MGEQLVFELVAPEPPASRTSFRGATARRWRPSAVPPPERLPSGASCCGARAAQASRTCSPQRWPRRRDTAGGPSCGRHRAPLTRTAPLAGRAGRRRRRRSRRCRRGGAPVHAVQRARRAWRHVRRRERAAARADRLARRRPHAPLLGPRARGRAARRRRQAGSARGLCPLARLHARRRGDRLPARAWPARHALAGRDAGGARPDVARAEAAGDRSAGARMAAALHRRIAARLDAHRASRAVSTPRAHGPLWAPTRAFRIALRNGAGRARTVRRPAGSGVGRQPVAPPPDEGGRDAAGR